MRLVVPIGFLVLLCSVGGQPAGGAVPVAPDTWQIVHDVVLLAQLAPLRLSSEQVTALCKILSEARAGPAVGEDLAAQLSRIKQSLLSGEQLQPRDLAQVAALARGGVERRMGRRLGPGTADKNLLDKLLGVLEDWQKAVLAGPLGALAPAAARARKRAVSDSDIRALLRLREIPPDRWPAEKQDLAKRFASLAEDAERAHMEAAAADFVERIHLMSEAEIRKRAAELAEEADTLTGGRASGLALLAPIDEESLRRRAAILLLDPALPRILAEMAAARGWPLQ